MGKKEFQNQTRSFPVAVCVGVGVSIAVMLIGAFAVALLISNETLADNTVGYCVLATMLISSMLGSAASILIAKRRLIIISLCTSIGFMLLLLSVTAMFYGGQYNGIPATFLVIIGGGISTALISGKKIYHSKTYHRKVKL